MASFPSRRSRGFLLGTQRRHVRKPRGREGWSLRLSPEPLEQRAMMAADTCEASTPYVIPDDAWAPPASIVVGPCFSPLAASPTEASPIAILVVPPPQMPVTSDAESLTESTPGMAVCYGPQSDPASVSPQPEADFQATADYVQMMAVMTGQAEAEARREAEEQARREADMWAEMAAFFSLQAWSSVDVASEPSSEEMSGPTWAVIVAAGVEPAPGMEAVTEADPSMAVCYGPQADPGSPAPQPEMDSWATVDSMQTMAAMTAQAEAEVRREAEEAARREADMRVQMAAFASLQAWSSAGDMGSASSSEEMSGPTCDVIVAAAGNPVSGECVEWSAMDVDPRAIASDGDVNWQIPEPMHVASFVTESTTDDVSMLCAPEDAGSAVASPGEWQQSGPGTPEPFSTLVDGRDATAAPPEPAWPGPGVVDEPGGFVSVAAGNSAVPDWAAAVAGDDAVGAASSEVAAAPDQSSVIDYVYDWEDEARRECADEAREELNHEVFEYANKLNIESEGRFAEGIVYTEAQLVARLQAHIDAPQAIDGVEYVDSGDADGSYSQQDDVSNDPLSWIPATKVTPRGTPTGVLSGWFADNAKASQEAGGVLGAVGHMVNGMAAGVVSLFDVVAVRAGWDVVSSVCFGAAWPRNPEPMPVQTREAAEFSDYIYDKKFNDNSPEAGGLLGALGIPYEPVGGLQAALFRGESGTFYLTARGTELFSLEDWKTNSQQNAGERTPAYDRFLEIVDGVQDKIAQLGGTLVLTGHSLGGSLVIAGAHQSGLPAEAFNPAYVRSTYADGQPAQIRVNVVVGDPLDLARLARWQPPQGTMHYYRPQLCKGFTHNMGHFHDRR